MGAIKPRINGRVVTLTTKGGMTFWSHDRGDWEWVSLRDLLGPPDEDVEWSFELLESEATRLRVEEYLAAHP